MIPLKHVQHDRSKIPPVRSYVGKMSLERALIIGMLDPDILYGPSEIANSVYPKGSLDALRVRKALWSFAKMKGIHESYDNIEPEAGAWKWYGSSWQYALGHRMKEICDFMDVLKQLMETYPHHEFFLIDERIVARDRSQGAIPFNREVIKCEDSNPHGPTRITTLTARRYRRFFVMAVAASFLIFALSHWFRDSPNEKPTRQLKPLSMQMTQEFDALITKILKIATEQSYGAAAEYLGGISAYQFGMDLIQKHNKAEAGLHWFKAMLDRPNLADKEREEFVFGKAWALWQMARTVDALTIATELDVIAKVPTVLARNSFLLGDIHYTSGNFILSRRFYEKSLTIYTDLNSQRGVFKTNIALANIDAIDNPGLIAGHIKAAKLANANLVSQNQAPFDDSYFAGVYRDAAFTQGRYGDALKWGKEEERLLRLNPDKQLAALVSKARVSVLLAVSGNIEGAVLHAREVDVEAEKVGLKSAKMINLFTWYYVGRCKGVDSSIYLKEINKYGEQINDYLYLRFPESLDKIPCQ